MADLKTVAICYTQDKKVKYVSFVRNVSYIECEKLCQDMLDYESEKEQVLLGLKLKIETLEDLVDSLNNEIKVLKGID